jgi:hypothetical protein
VQLCDHRQQLLQQHPHCILQTLDKLLLLLLLLLLKVTPSCQQC